jgi:hypothetical protein
MGGEVKTGLAEMAASVTKNRKLWVLLTNLLVGNALFAYAFEEFYAPVYLCLNLVALVGLWFCLRHKSATKSDEYLKGFFVTFAIPWIAFNVYQIIMLTILLFRGTSKTIWDMLGGMLGLNLGVLFTIPLKPFWWLALLLFAFLNGFLFCWAWKTPPLPQSPLQAPP